MAGSWALWAPDPDGRGMRGGMRGLYGSYYFLFGINILGIYSFWGSGFFSAAIGDTSFMLLLGDIIS